MDMGLLRKLTMPVHGGTERILPIDSKMGQREKRRVVQAALRFAEDLISCRA